VVARFLTLKLTLMGNTFRKSVWQTIGMIVAALYALGVVGMLVTLVGALAFVGDPAWAGLAITLGGALTVVGWWLIPIFAFGVDATLDPHRFATYAIPRRTLLAGLAVASLVSVPGIATVLVALGTSFAWVLEPGVLVVALVGAVLGVATCVLGSRAITTLLAPVLESRRYREVVTIVAVVLVVMTGPLIGWLANGVEVAVEVDPESGSSTGTQLLPLFEQAAAVVGWTPFGAAWSLAGTAHDGDWVGLAGRLAIALGTIGLAWLAWDRALARALVRPPVGDGRGSRAKGLGAFGRVPFSPTWAVAARTATYWIRDPRYFGSVAIVPLLPVIMYLSSQGTGSFFLLLATGPFVAWILGFSISNDIAYDNTAFALHVAAGVDGRADRWGRALPMLLVGPVISAATVVVSVWVADSWHLTLPLLGLALGLLLVSTAVSCAVSARLVYPVAKPGESPLKSPQGAATATMVSQGLGFLVTLGLSLPVLAVGIGAVLLGGALWGIATLVVGILYGALILVLAVRFGARVYERRLPELLQQVQSFP
jgi:ABC-2 type transport system permease protein